MEKNTISHKLIKTLIRIRNVEQTFLDLFSQGHLNGTVHTCIGQELSALAFAGQLKKTDFVFSNHRCHGHFIAYTNEWKPLMLELLGKKDGVCGGVGSSQHLQLYNFFSNGIQGGIMPMAAGFALGNKLKQNDAIGVVYIGDGTLGEGVVYETLNFISKKEIPVIVVCENNKYAQSTPIEYNLAGSIELRAKAFGIEFRNSSTSGETANIIDEAKASIDWVRANKKPIFHLVDTYRLKAHSKGDDDRDQSEIETNAKNDFLNILAENDPEYFKKENDKIQAEIDKFIETALTEDELSIEDYNYAEQEEKYREDVEFSPYETKKGRLVQKMNASFKKLLEDKKVIFIGEDIMDPYGGAFKVSKGLSDTFPEQVIGTSISEGLIAGVSNGLALNGFKPFAEFMFGDFTALAFDQMINHASKIYNMYNKKVTCPVVFRTPMGGGRGYGPTHSQSIEKHYIGMDAFEICASNRYLDPDIILNYLYERKHPSLLIENKVDYAKNSTISLPNGYEMLQSIEALPSILIRPTSDHAKTTIITYGGSADVVINNIENYFYEYDNLVQVLLLTKIDPIPKRLLKTVLQNASSVLFVEEGNSGGTVGDYFISYLAQNFNNLNLKAIASERISIPSAKSLEDTVLINKANIYSNLNGVDA
ncbi:pyruvate dehydrogenase [Subsaximicrobium wynnwilliamsii]|uniref:Pyruvate dehydrogenase n=1 Tax=Subsaximicrobium wynnwilliamsii TaxID=291179 RepID=A0A5C6ZG65_9FLAO|nr:thiamine pyrophosphate-dependent enzyme [Subsaximicrobium wynnwilliamsii]TXD81376.1 pyruvate dehydrogenase [Subsaximicrobium wynnwilliamsii]TXD89072.1 pyruvate dehydrogenase [Subsaximicrobium wynnwilliamsii]TXE00750.1 pyruvate dehydrogenase [Subsaximicrobium wynnwilliamsii]